ncbi:MAG: CotH kinase family protein [Planctomycetales bacterium]|nr:CotH kinase family protein [bacterium]UNM07904.1 MAG: CotH kinase family protein [Planctomycetales bacterium]
MRYLIATGLTAILACLLCGCPSGGQQQGTQQAKKGGTTSSVPASGKSSEVLRSSEVALRLAGSFESSGSANYSRSGAMVLGGEESSSVTYEIGRLRNGDQLDKLILDLGRGRQDGSECSLKIALAGADAWQEFPLSALDHPQEVLLSDRGISATNDAAIFLRLECKAGNGVEIRDITAFMVLSSQDAARIEVDVPATDAREVDIRIPMRALDADGRVATGYSGLAEMDVVRDEHVMRIPLAFSEGLTDTTFKLSELGTYDVQFRCDLQEPILTAIDIYDAVLPVYEIKLQQARPIRFDSLDFPALDTFGSITTPQSGTVRAVVNGLPLERSESTHRPLFLQLPEGMQDDGLGYSRKAAELRHAEFDPLQLRDLLAGVVADRAGVEHLRKRAVHLRVNGVYQGVYIDAEVPDTAWMASRGLADDAELYLMQGAGGLNPREDLRFYDDLMMRVRVPQGGMEQLNEKLTEAGRLYIDAPQEERFGGIGAMFDNAKLADYFLLLSFCSANDNYRRDYGVIDPGSGVLWSMLPTGMSLTFGITGLNNPYADPEGFAPANELDMVGSIEDNIVLRAFLSSNEGQALVYERMKELMAGSLSEDSLTGEADRLWATMKAEMLADPLVGFDEAALDKQLELLHGNIREHWQFMRSEANDMPDDHSGHDH